MQKKKNGRIPHLKRATLTLPVSMNFHGWIADWQFCKM